MTIEEQSLENWFNTYIDIEDLENFINLLEDGEIVILVYRSFYPEKSSLVLAYFVISYENNKIESRNFISIVVM